MPAASTTPRGPLAWLGRRGVRVELREVDVGLVQVLIRSRASGSMGMVVTPWLVDDVLVDSGYIHARTQLHDALADHRLRAIALTHHHEDHLGTAGPLAEHHRCPVYLRHPARAGTEGLSDLPPYRQLYWGTPAPCPLEQMPEKIHTARRVLRVVPTPGHSSTHVVLLDEQTGALLGGDLYISGGATAVMSHEDPWELVRSLRRAAELQPTRLLTGHGLVVDDPVERLQLKASRIERAASQCVELAGQGLAPDAIRARVFTRGRARDLLLASLSGGDFSRANFVLNAIASAADRA